MIDKNEKAWWRHCFNLVEQVSKSHPGRPLTEFADELDRETGLTGWNVRAMAMGGSTYDNPPMPAGWVSPWCFETLECGGFCHLAPEHDGPHLCVGDTDGPGSCPA